MKLSPILTKTQFAVQFKQFGRFNRMAVYDTKAQAEAMVARNFKGREADTKIKEVETPHEFVLFIEGNELTQGRYPTLASALKAKRRLEKCGHVASVCQFVNRGLAEKVRVA